MALRPLVKTAESCYAWCGTISNLARNAANRPLLGTAAVRDALVALQPHATTTDACQWGIRRAPLALISKSQEATCRHPPRSLRRPR